jgi:hydroxymethylbilane synthase
MTRRSLAAGTRGSKLALIQTEWVIAQINKAHPEFHIEPLVITTSGDHSTEATLGEGVFVKEIQQALLERKIDLAVHSLKDLPTDEVYGIEIAAIPVRADPREALVGSALEDLIPGAVVGTGSPRRSAQLKRLRPDLAVVPVRGNVPTRVEKARRGEVAAVVLAKAGLDRLGIEPDDVFEEEVFLPAPGQGALAVEVRAGDDKVLKIVRSIDEPSARIAVQTERALLRALGGGCLLPIGAWGRVLAERLLLDACVVSSDGTRMASASISGSPDESQEVAQKAAEDLIEQGALEMLEGTVHAE